MTNDGRDAVIWTRRSTRCAEDHCVIVSLLPTAVRISESDYPCRSFAVPRRSWEIFLSGIQIGRFDNSAENVAG
jgi:hypothetical protein